MDFLYANDSSGVPVEVFIAVAGVNLVYQFWVHTEHIGNLGFLEKDIYYTNESSNTSC